VSDWQLIILALAVALATLFVFVALLERRDRKHRRPN
jgi:hypothetical protein